MLNGAEPMFNGMIEPDGYDTDRRLGLKRAISALKPHLSFMAGALSFKPSVEIYFSRNQVMRSREGDLGSSTRGAYSLLSDIGYEAACIVLGTGGLEWFKTVVFPHVSDLTGKEVEDIETYISDGGTAIIDLPPGIRKRSPAAGCFIATALPCTKGPGRLWNPLSVILSNRILSLKGRMKSSGHIWKPGSLKTRIPAGDSFFSTTAHQINLTQ